MDNKEILARAHAYIAEEKDNAFRNQVQNLIHKEDYTELKERFYQSLEFGTGGLRGIVGGGTNRINTYMINRATQGLAAYVAKANPEKEKNGTLQAVVAYDSRNFSDVFAEATALIFAANGFKTYLFSDLRPTPELSFAITELNCQTGVVITASHNSREYNGYKAYWSNGAQVIPPHDTGIIDEVNAVKHVKTTTRSEAIASGRLEIIDSIIDEKYWQMCQDQLFRPDLIKKTAQHAKVVFTPLHGTGAKHVEKVLGNLGLSVITVPEQREPDGNFPTISKPNPEEACALKMAVALAKKEKADIVMATDPDSDRLGTAVPDNDGNFVLLTGNQMGVLLADYIILSRKEFNKMPKNPAIVRTIVTSNMIDTIAHKNGVYVEEVLTGFKWIADAMIRYKKSGKHQFIFGLEESYGYLVETAVRDKDAISAAAMCAEMTLYWRSNGKSLLDRLEDLWTTYGYYEDRAIDKMFPGLSGFETMQNLMTNLRTQAPKSLGGEEVVQVRDILNLVSYHPSNKDTQTKLALPSSNGLQFVLKGGTVVSARPSGTEPKIKFYINSSVPASGNLLADKKAGSSLCDAISLDINIILDNA
ncbi:MAG TPA: phospho-sugar mutase [Treponemataceae bacterium]|nr:phospho-sugar mutase [Treponemataceae bacterium]